MIIVITEFFIKKNTIRYSYKMVVLDVNVDEFKFIYWLNYFRFIIRKNKNLCKKKTI